MLSNSSLSDGHEQLLSSPNGYSRLSLEIFVVGPDSIVPERQGQCHKRCVVRIDLLHEFLCLGQERCKILGRDDRNISQQELYQEVDLISADPRLLNEKGFMVLKLLESVFGQEKLKRRMQKYEASDGIAEKRMFVSRISFMNYEKCFASPSLIL
jgi:hypothetical protein